MTRLQRLPRAAAVEQGIDYFFDDSAAQHAVDFFHDYLRHSKGRWAGEPFRLLDWQRVDIIEELFGWLRVKNGFRRYRLGYIEVPKKNGKSTLLSGIGTYLLAADGEPGAEVYGAAVDRNQASIVYNEAAECVRRSPLLAADLEVVPSRRTIAYKAAASFYRVLSADAIRSEGLNIHGLLFDELHAQRTRRLWDALRYGGSSRQQSLLLAITTAGYDRNSICWEQHAYAERVLADWTVDPTFFAYIRAASPDDDWRSPETWRKANPSFGITINEDDFAAEAREAEQSPSKLNSFLRYRLNVWTQQDTRWIPPETWSAGNAPPPVSLAGRDCWLALDLAYSEDTSASVAIFPDENGDVDVLCRFYLPGDGMAERERRDAFPYGQYVASGLIVATPGETTDYDWIRKDIEEFSKRYRIRRVAIDPWQAIQLGNQLQGLGLDVVKYKQGFGGFNAPCRQLENLLSKGKLRHAGNHVLAWQAQNVTLRTNAEGMVRPLKPKDSGGARVDGMIALLMALGAWSAEESKPARRPPQIHAI
jgi:phage terminase large subunit-like protein